VTVSTNLGAWVNRRGIFGRDALADIFREQHIASASVGNSPLPASISNSASPR